MFKKTNFGLYLVPLISNEFLRKTMTIVEYGQ